MHAFTVIHGIGVPTYNLVDESGYFTLGDASGVLSVQANVTVGVYTVSVAVSDESGNEAAAVATVEAVPMLSLADAPLLSVVVDNALELHTFTAVGGLKAKTYNLVGAPGYFTLGASSGILSVQAVSEVGIYTVSVEVSDSAGNQATAQATVEIIARLSLKDAPPLEALARLSVTVTLHTFAAGGGYGAKRYTLIADEAGYFAIDADSGELSLLSNSAMLAGDYTLRVEVSDGLTPPHRVTAAAAVQIARSGIFVLGGSSTNITKDVWRWSADGKAWKQETASASWSARYRHQAVAYRGRLYVMGGQTTNSSSSYLQDVWSSADGKNWVSEITPGWTARTGHQAVEYQGRLYVMGGGGRQVWSWAEGEESWRAEGAAAWPARQGRQAVVHNGRIYVMGGRSSNNAFNDVWSWADGENNWSFEGNAPWPGRYEHQAVSHMGRLYVLGGWGDSRKNDVWSSLDGKNWRQETAEAAWRARQGHQVVSRYGRLYLMGGYAGSIKRDVWSSVDGKSWVQEKPANANWSARDYHQAVVFPPSLALSGTSETITLTMQAAAVALHTLSAQYGVGQYTYSLASEVTGFGIDKSSGVLSADGNAEVGDYTLTVQVEDEEGSRAETVVQVEIVAASIAALSAVERFAWSGSGGIRNDLGLSEHGGSGRREGEVATFSANDAVSRIGVGRMMDN